MDMKLNSTVIRQQRENRAWSQEHLAAATGLALRTIQRIESTGSASYDSASAIAAVFNLPVTALRSDEIEDATRTRVGHQWFTWHRLLTLLGCGLLGAIFSPPNFRLNIAVAVTLWLCCELAIYTRRSARGMDPS
jgi:transcriptional regulator with XRE-family HTH domain